jgi:type II secretory pathway predicted ATPase ExeA
MYEAFYNLKHKPFSLLPDPEFLFLSKKHAIALSLLDYSLTGQAGFCVITGEIGSGKTTLIRAFLGRINRDFTVGLISNTHAGLKDVAAWALSAFGHTVASGTGQAETYQQLVNYLISEYAAGRQCVLIVDEAQNLSLEGLEELRLLSNINSGKDLLLQIVLSGQPQLSEKLKRPELVQFVQRISVSYHLSPLAYADTRRYIQHRLKVAGADRPIFTEMAMGAIQYFSGGTPRLINSVCDMALVYGFADAVEVIDEELVIRVTSDRQADGIVAFERNAPADVMRAEIRDLARSAGVVEADHPIEGQPVPEAVATPRPQSGRRMKSPMLVESAPMISAPPPKAPVTVEAIKPRAVRAEIAAPDRNTVDNSTVDNSTNDNSTNDHNTGDHNKGGGNDYYFREADDDELVLTLEVSDEPEPEEPRQLAMPMLNHVDVPSLGGAEPHIGELSRSNGQESHPNWQVPAARIPDKPWPSIRNHAQAELRATDSPIVEPESGTSVVPRRSWWRRSFSRGE